MSTTNMTLEQVVDYWTSQGLAVVPADVVKGVHDQVMASRTPINRNPFVEKIVMVGNHAESRRPTMVTIQQRGAEVSYNTLSSLNNKTPFEWMAITKAAVQNGTK